MTDRDPILCECKLHYMDTDDYSMFMKSWKLARKKMKNLAGAENGNYGKYTPLKDILNTVIPSLDSHDLILMGGCTTENNEICLTLTVKHTASAHYERATIPLSHPAICVLNKANQEQRFGAANTYIKRYFIPNIFSLVVNAPDIDQMEFAEFITKDQIEKIEALIASKKTPKIKEKILEECDIYSIHQMPAKYFDAVIKRLNLSK